MLVSLQVSDMQLPQNDHDNGAVGFNGSFIFYWPSPKVVNPNIGKFRMPLKNKNSKVV